MILLEATLLVAAARAWLWICDRYVGPDDSDTPAGL